MIFFKRPEAIKHEIWVEMQEYVLYVAISCLILYILHQCVNYFLYKRAIKRGALEAIKEYESKKKQQ